MHDVFVSDERKRENIPWPSFLQFLLHLPQKQWFFLSTQGLQATIGPFLSASPRHLQRWSMAHIRTYCHPQHEGAPYYPILLGQKRHSKFRVADFQCACEGRHDMKWCWGMMWGSRVWWLNAKPYCRYCTSSWPPTLKVMWTGWLQEEERNWQGVYHLDFRHYTVGTRNPLTALAAFKTTKYTTAARKSEEKNSDLDVRIP